MELQQVIKIPYRPRPLQNKLHKQLSLHRWSVVLCHRRFGKTVMAINNLIREAIICEKEAPRMAYIAPTYRMAKQVAWDYVKQYTKVIPGVRYHETELRCDLPNGARILLLGSENPDSLRGIYLDLCVIDETAQVSSTLFPEVVRPCLSDRKGGCIFLGTPNGMQNTFYEVWEQAEGQKDWYRAVFKASETEILDDEELESAKLSMSEDQFNQEYECSWTAAIPGAIYAKELEKIEKQITNVPYDPTHKVETFWDLGVNDSTAIWFIQKIGRAVHVIDYYEARNEGLPHYQRVLDSKDYAYGDHYAPHDIEVRELGTGKSRREIAYDLGISFRVVAKLPIEDGIHAAKLLIPRCWFDKENTKVGLESLRHYHRAWNDRMRTFKNTPVHDFSSHAADAFRYLAVGIREGSGNFRPNQMVAEMDYSVFGAAV